MAEWPQSGQTFGSYERFTQLVGGIIDNAGISGFLTNQRDSYEVIAKEETEWKRFAAAWYVEYSSNPLGALAFCKFAIDKGLLMSVMDGRESSKAVLAMGKAISTRAGQRFGDLTIKRVRRERSGSWSYQVIEVSSTIPSAPSAA